MKKLSIITALAFAFAAPAAFGDGDNKIRARLTGYQEVPSVSTPASGRFEAEVAADGNIDYELSYSGLQAEVRQAHIHVGQRSANGAIVIWICGSTTNPGPAGTRACPQSGTITGTIRPADVQVVAAQGFAANELAEVVSAIRAGVAYVNVHTAQSTGGEIRGQLRARGMHGDGNRGGGHGH